MNLSRSERMSLAAVNQRRADLAKCSQKHRQNLISLAHAAPALVEVEGSLVFITDAGRAALAEGGK